MSRAQPALSRQESKAVTRKRLIRGAIELMRTRGVEAATTGRIASAAGIAQSSFYGHFADRDACFQAVAETIGAYVLRRAREQSAALDPADVRGSIRRVYKAVIDAFVSSPEMTRIFLRYRGDDASALGRTFGALVDRSRIELQGRLREYGVAGHALTNTKVYAELLVDSTLGVVEGLIVGRLDDPDAAVEALTNVAYATITYGLAGEASK